MRSVPETDFNLSYESLTSRAARQATLDFRLTNPDVYIDITLGSTTAADLTEDLKPEVGSPSVKESDDEDVGEDQGLTVEELSNMLLEFRLSSGRVSRVDGVSLDSGVAIMTRSGRFSRPSVRFTNS